MMKRILLIVVALVLLAGLASLPAQADTGDQVHETVFDVPCSLGVGIAFDGQHLWYSCHSGSPNLFRADALTGIVDRSYDVPDVERRVDALSYDATRNVIWAAVPPNEIWRIDLDANKELVAQSHYKTVNDDCSILDGLAFDARNVADPTDDVFYYSDDCWTIVIDVYDFNPGNPAPIESFSWAGAGAHNSGLAVGGQLLFQTDMFNADVYVVDKTTKVDQFNYSVDLPHPEDQECDTDTFVGLGKDVMWIKEAYEAKARAFEIPRGTCGIGGVAGKREKRLVAGPEEIGIYLSGPTQYVFDIDYTGPAALVVDTVPAEFEIITLDPTAGTVAAFDTSQGKGNSANRIEWEVLAGASTLTVVIQTVGSPGKGHRNPVFKPTSCGNLPLNDGATAYEVDEEGNLVIDPEGNRIVIVGPSDPLWVVAVAGEKPCEDIIIDADGTTSPGDGVPGAVEVFKGAPLTAWPTTRYIEGLDMFDNDGDAAWTFGYNGDDLHVEDPTTHPGAIRDGFHDDFLDPIVLDWDGSLDLPPNKDPVSCDMETGTFCPAGLPGNIKFYDTSGNGFWDDGEDIVLDVNGNGVFD
jgi:hypothetical protein